MRGLMWFCLGVGVGATAAYLVTKQKYEKIAEEDVRKAKEHYEVEKSAEGAKEEKTEKADSSIEKTASDYIGKTTSYHDYNSITKSMKDISNAVNKHYGKPYQITADQFVNEEEFYDKTTLTYYGGADFLDEDGKSVSIDKTVSEEELEDILIDHATPSGLDVYYVRNDILRSDYEIILDMEVPDEVD